MGVKIQTIKDIRLYLAKELNKIYPETEISALTNIIIKTINGVSRLHQLYLAEQPVTGLQAQKVIYISTELKTGKPIQYILGETIFYDCIIRVSKATLIPRPETEELVDLIISENKGFTGNIIDIGTGSGCIAIALAKNIPGTLVSGIDISKEAIRIARGNAFLNNVSVSFKYCDIFNFDYENNCRVGIIVSNPPYVRFSEQQYMGKNVLDFEPHSALFVSDSDPLLYYKAIIKVAEKTLLPGGILYFEINEAMGKAMILLLEATGYSHIQVVTDINGKDRIIKGRKDA
jgi:release factor glutamine methyltransferase